MVSGVVSKLCQSFWYFMIFLRMQVPKQMLKVALKVKKSFIGKDPYVG